MASTRRIPTSSSHRSEIDKMGDDLEMQAAEDIPSPALEQTTEKKERRKRWGEETEAGKKVLESVADGSSADPATKKRKSRWEETPPVVSPTLLMPLGMNGSIILPAALAALVDLNPETLELQRQLNQINNRLQIMNSSIFVDDTPPERRSPSPPPIYNEVGARINTREQRAKEKLMKERTVRLRMVWHGCIEISN